MELIYSSLLLHAVKKPITEENINKIFSAVGATIDIVKVKALVAVMENVNIDDAIAKASMPIAAPAEAKAEKKEEKKEEDVEKRAESAVEGLAGLFG